ITQICTNCEIPGGYRASTAMIFALHQIHVAFIVHHYESSPFLQNFLRELVSEQYLWASATTESAGGSDLRSSVVAVDVEGDRFTLEKQAPVISYGEAADYVMVTCRRAEDAQSSDQVQVLVNKKEATLEQISGWDTLGFR